MKYRSAYTHTITLITYCLILILASDVNARPVKKRQTESVDTFLDKVTPSNDNTNTLDQSDSHMYFEISLNVDLSTSEGRDIRKTLSDVFKVDMKNASLDNVELSNYKLKVRLPVHSELIEYSDLLNVKAKAIASGQ